MHTPVLGEPTEEKLVQDYVSRWYGRRYSGTGFLYHARIVTRMLEGASFRHGRKAVTKILDVGCGTGFVSQLYPNFDIVGIDISDEMLARNPYKWVKAPAEAIPFPDGTFDFVVVRSLLHHLEKPEVGLKEIHRVLKPGGRFVCWETNFSILNDWMRRLAKKTKRFSHLHKNFKRAELLGMIKDAGFAVDQVYLHGILSYPLAGFPDILDLKLPIWLGRILLRMDDLMAKTPIKYLSFSLMVKASKPVPVAQEAERGDVAPKVVDAISTGHPIEK